MITVILSNGTRRAIKVGSNTMGMRIRAIEITSASDVTGEKVEDWFRTSLLTRLVPLGAPQEDQANG